MGIWNSYYLIFTYGVILQLGVFSGLNRDLPFFYGKNEKDHALTLAKSALWFSRFCTISISIILIIAYFFIRNRISVDSELAFVAASLTLIIFFYQNYLTVTFRTNKAFNKLVIIYFIQSALTLLSIVLVYHFSYNGMLFRIVFLAITLVFMLHIKRPIIINPKKSLIHLKELIWSGFPLYLFGYLKSISFTLNRVLLLKFSGTFLLGIYSPALAILSVMNILPSIVGQYLYPQMSYEFGRTGDLQKLWTWTWKSTVYILIVLLPFAILAYWLLPHLITNYFPSYIEGIFAAKISIFSGIITGSLVGSNVLYSIKNYRALSYTTFLKFLTNIFFMYLFMRLIDPLNGIAIGLLISDFINFIFTLIVIRKALIGKYFI